jgi:RimJ/RimL family protein N-acetyltransferase
LTTAAAYRNTPRVLIDLWPLFGLRLRSPRLELRLPRDEELAALAELAAVGMYPPGPRPFWIDWPERPPADRARALYQDHLSARATWSPADWSLPLAVYQDGTVIGAQHLSARYFSHLREVGSFSWLGPAYAGRGFGTEMRWAVLELAFAGLGAAEATSGAFVDNPASIGVSRKIGYEADGLVRDYTPDGQIRTTQRQRLSRERWAAATRPPVTIEGLDACRSMFGV